MFASEANGVGEPLRLNTQERLEAIQAPERVQSERFAGWRGQMAGRESGESGAYRHDRSEEQPAKAGTY
ncbi:hypothetical protein AO071_05170 [Pseudomonas syringae]|nr:hypothetical protein AO071_05170 [Pseudomonas syringae]